MKVLFFFSSCTAPFTFFKKLGIPGPETVPFFGNTASMIFKVNLICVSVIVPYHFDNSQFCVAFLRNQIIVLISLNSLTNFQNFTWNGTRSMVKSLGKYQSFMVIYRVIHQRCFVATSVSRIMK